MLYLEKARYMQKLLLIWLWVKSFILFYKSVFVFLFLECMQTEYFIHADGCIKYTHKYMTESDGFSSTINETCLLWL